MKEWSPFGDIFPAHIDNYLVSKGGEFRITNLGNGKSKLVGTTWYSHKIAPEFYWRLWSDFILHRIHTRVLTHIKERSELKKK